MNSVYAIFRESAAGFPDHDFLAVPPLPSRRYHATGWTITYAEALDEVERIRKPFLDAGYGVGHRVGLLFENRPEHLLHFLALNALGVSIVPINPDYRRDEIRYLMEHSELELTLTLPERVEALREAAREVPGQPPVLASLDALPRPRTPRRDEVPSAATEASLLYTSGTTGRPKGCILTNDYHVTVGRTYLECGGLVTIRRGEERIYNPLPLFHMNAGIFSFMCMMMSGGCAILPDRFHPQSWWQEIGDSRATIIHYLGVVPAMLLKLPGSPLERAHRVRYGVGAGVEPELHGAFEARFGFPLIELWGMTETGGGFVAKDEPRRIDTRAIGRPGKRAGLDLEARIVDDHEVEVPLGEAGELLVRRLGPLPRAGLFSGYLKNGAATAEAWRGGWFHTGDVARQDESGMIFFVDRKKNIIRRSGENIAAAEVEATLLAHDQVAQAAVLAVPDEIRGEEVMACIVVKAGIPPSPALAGSLFDWCNERLAYYKPPGWILFLDRLPTTGTQKIQKSQIFAPGEDPCRRAGAIDLRRRKRRGS
ncbi:MAG TPA: AMP-binding protein [Stellaceae bacterium]|nr:AMP-binding protein [Stellaceae bacterium]